jgi:hypothetical protein
LSKHSAVREDNKLEGLHNGGSSSTGDGIGRAGDSESAVGRGGLECGFSVVSVLLGMHLGNALVLGGIRKAPVVLGDSRRCGGRRSEARSEFLEGYSVTKSESVSVGHLCLCDVHDVSEIHGGDTGISNNVGKVRRAHAGVGGCVNILSLDCCAHNGSGILASVGGGIEIHGCIAHRGCDTSIAHDHRHGWRANTNVGSCINILALDCASDGSGILATVHGGIVYLRCSAHSGYNTGIAKNQWHG